MQLSEQTGELFSALAEFQSEHPEIIKDAKVDVKKNGKFLYSFDYATLGNMIDTVTPTLSKHGLSVTQSVGNSGVITIIGHKSGQWMMTEPLQVDFSGSEQEQGSSITYKRRYQFGGALNLDSIKDDDANSANGNEASFVEKSAPKKSSPEPKKEEKKSESKPKKTEPSGDLDKATSPQEAIDIIRATEENPDQVRNQLLQWYTAKQKKDAEFKEKYHSEMMQRMQSPNLELKDD